MKVDSVFPPPRRVRGGHERVTWAFEASPLERLTVTIHLLPEGSGELRAIVGVGTGPGVAFRQWVYP